MSREIKNAVRDKYASVAVSRLSTKHSGVKAVAEAFGYSADELSSIPEEANMGLSCGNPTAFASLKPGEIVVDLGCGGGLDVFLAARRVGLTGKAIGIDMTPEMIARAKRNAETADDGGPMTNVEFHLAEIEKMPLADGSVDCIISNCVINLAPDKRAVFREAARVLKAGGRFAVSDIALKKPLPPELAQDLLAYVGCISGAISIEDYRSGLLDAGFSSVDIIGSGSDLNAYSKVENQSGCCSPVMTEPQTQVPDANRRAGTLAIGSAHCCTPAAPATGDSSALHGGLAELLRKYDVNDYAASVKVFAVKRA